MDYTIRARIVVEDSSTAGARSAQRKLEDVERTGKRVSFSLTTMFQRAFMVIGGAGGAGYALRGILRLHTSIQEAQTGMATLLSAQTGAPILATLGQAREIVQGLRKDAAVGVGELEDYITGMQSILGPGLQAGASLDQLRELNRLTLAAGFALRGQEGLRLAPMDIAQALTRGASRIETPIVMQALAAVRMTAEEFNKLDTGGRMKVLQEAFGKFGPGVEAMGRGWNAQFSTLLDRLKELARTATEPLFGRWSDQLRRANEWLERNEGRLQVIVERWGPRLVAMWDHLIEQAGTYAAIVAGASLAQYGPGALGAAGRAGGGARDTWSRVAGAAAWGANLPGRGGFFGRMAGGAAGAGGEILAILKPIGTAFSKVAGPIAVVTTLVMGLFGAMKEFAGLRAWVMQAWAYLVSSFAGLGEAFGMLTAKGSSLNLIGGLLAGTFGVLAYIIGGVVRVVASLVAVFGAMLQVVGDWARGMGEVLRGNFPAAQTWFKKMGQDAFNNKALQDTLANLWAPTKQGAKDAAAAGTPPATGSVPHNQVNIGKVEIKNEVRDIKDLPILVRSFDDLIDRVSTYRRGSRRIPVPT